MSYIQYIEKFNQAHMLYLKDRFSVEARSSLAGMLKEMHAEVVVEYL